jgi:hypothetical protein
VHLDAVRKRLMDAVVRSADTKILPANPQSDAAIAS